MRILTLLWVAISICYQSQAAQFNYSVQCDNPQDCPEWFAGLVHKEGVCSSFLVKKDVVATNFHCIPKSLTREGAFCDNGIEFVFPKTATHAEERIPCDRIVYLSPPLGKEIIKPDFAFVRLKTSPKRRPAPINQRGFPDNSEVVMYKMDPNPTGQTGVVRKAICKAIQHSVINPYFTKDTAPLVLLTGCNIIKGNSGSPLLVNNEVHGIVSATMEIMTPAILQARVGSAPRLNFGFGSNFSCLSQSDLGFFMDKIIDCEVPIDAETQRQKAADLVKTKLDKALDDLQTKVNNSTQKDLLAGKPLVLWKAREEKPKAVTDNYLLKVNFQPLCLLPKTSSLAPYEKRLSKKTVSMPQDLPEYTLSEKLDPYLRYDVAVQEKRGTVPLSLIPKQLLQKKAIPIHFNNQETLLDLCSEMRARK